MSEHEQQVFSSTIMTYSEQQGLSPHDDLLAVEEPLEIRLRYTHKHVSLSRNIAITMRTPGDDLSLAAGFLHTENLLPSADAIAQIAHTHKNGNVVEVTLQPEIRVDLKRLERHFYMSSSCGVCGKASLDAVSTLTDDVSLSQDVRLPPEMILSLSSRLRQEQRVFASTGGLHAAGIFSPDGALIASAEDIGRHNAVDKVIGHMLRERLDMTHTALVISGRAGFEIIQKAIVAHIPILIAVGAPSSLALQLARRFDATLIGFLKPHKFNLYSGQQRVQDPARS